MIGLLLLAFIFGAVVTLMIQFVWFYQKFQKKPSSFNPKISQFDSIRLPSELSKLISNVDGEAKKESCLFVNLIVQFLFRELKDTKKVRKHMDVVNVDMGVCCMTQDDTVDRVMWRTNIRAVDPAPELDQRQERWCLKKLNAEFEELLQTTSGKLLNQIVVQDLNLGTMFPIIHSVLVKHVLTSEDDQSIEELDMCFDIDYRGGCHLAVQADLMFGRSAYLSVKLLRLKGALRVQFTRLPFTHWSFSFYNDPQVDFEVESRFEGHMITQLASLITNQIRRTIRKKHTLPNYKMRFKPFFTLPEIPALTRPLKFHGYTIGEGHFDVVLMECSRLIKVPPDAQLYCTLSIGSLPWQVCAIRSRYSSSDIDVTKTPADAFGLVFTEIFEPRRLEAVVIIESIVSDSPASNANIHKNDIVVCINGQRVTSSKHASSLIKVALDRLSLKIERPTSKRKNYKLDEDIINAQAASKKESPPRIIEDDFVNITIMTSELGTSKVVMSDKKGTPPSDSPLKKYAVSESTSKESTKKQSDIQTRKVSSDSTKKVSLSDPTLKKGGTARSGYDNRQSTSDVLKKVGSSESLKKAVMSEAKKAGETGGRGVAKSAQSTPELPRRSAPRDIPNREASSTEGTPLNQSPANDGSCDVDDAVDGTKIEGDGDVEMSDVEETPTEILKSQFVPASRNPLWNEKFEFDVGESQDDTINVCVWCKAIEKSNERVLKPTQDFIIGYVSLNLSNIALECLSTLQGDTQKTIHLSPPDGHHHSAAHVKLPNLGSHSGFDPSLCYGDITLEISHHPHHMPVNLRKRLTKDTQVERVSHSAENAVPTTPKDQRHTFLGTHFTSATYCNFCGKKIWLKVAFQCAVCKMICHKKCTDKCRLQTLCSRERVQPKKRSGTQSLPDSADQSDGAKSVSSSLLNRFKKESTVKIIADTATPTPHDTADDLSMTSDLDIPPRPRRNSAPEDTPIKDTNQLTVEGIHRARSSTSLNSVFCSNESPATATHRIRQHLEDLTRGDVASSVPQVLVQVAQNRLAGTVNEHLEDLTRGDVASSVPQVLVQVAQNRLAGTVNEVMVTSAKEKGRELFADLSLDERKRKLDDMVTKLQQEIDVESDQSADVSRLIKDTNDERRRTKLKKQLTKSEDRLQALMVLMVHYCAGLQHCMDMEHDQPATDTTTPVQPPTDTSKQAVQSSTDASKLPQGDKDVSKSPVTTANASKSQVSMTIDASKQPKRAKDVSKTPVAIAKDASKQPIQPPKNISKSPVPTAKSPPRATDARKQPIQPPTDVSKSSIQTSKDLPLQPAKNISKSPAKHTPVQRTNDVGKPPIKSADAAAIPRVQSSGIVNIPTRQPANSIDTLMGQPADGIKIPQVKINNDVGTPTVQSDSIITTIQPLNGAQGSTNGSCTDIEETQF